jgi:hypothetical protein
MGSPIPALSFVLSAVSPGLGALTATVPQWLERVAGIKPDGGDGSVEWGLMLSLLIASLSFATLARRSAGQYTRLGSTVPDLANRPSFSRGSDGRDHRP